MQDQEIHEELLKKADQEALRRGLPGLRPLQREVFYHLAFRRSVFARLPTGYGKSLCYWMPAAAWGWKVWVISPLVSLIEDQAMACASLGIRVLAWHGALTASRRRELEMEMEGGNWQVCLLSPERLTAWAVRGYLRTLQELGCDADLLVLDEMHCLEEWREFRGGYRDLFEHVHRATGKGALLLGLSASLSEANSRAWMTELCGEHTQVSTGLGRANLCLQVLAVEEEEERWLFLLSALREIRAPESALVYCGTREETDNVARWLRSAGVPAVAYHAGLPCEERAARSRAFREGKFRVVCATSAFGMGIDYPYVSLVIHFSMPHDLESYWQEVGRAGRSGQPAYGIAFWRRSEIARARYLKGEALQRFAALWRAWALGCCRKKAVAERLGIAEGNCGNCDRCLAGGMPASPVGSALPRPWWTTAEAELAIWSEGRLPAAQGGT